MEWNRLNNMKIWSLWDGVGPECLDFAHDK